MKIRRSVAASATALALTITMTACSGAGTKPIATSGGNAAITLGLVQGTDYIHAMPAQVAAAQGFFKAEHLTVKIVGFTSGSDLTKAIAGGSVDVAEATGLDAVSAQAHGVDVKAFFGVEGASPMTLIVPKNSAISSFSDLKGKKVGISAVGSMTDYVLRAALAKVGVPFAGVKEVALGAPAATIAAMQHGDIDALVLPTSFGYTVESDGSGKIAQPAADVLGKDDQFAVLMAPTATLKASTPVLKRMAAAYTKAIDWMKANQSGTVSLAEQKLGMSAAVADKTYDALMSGFTPDGTLSAPGLAAYAKALPTLKIATKAPDASSYLTTTIVGG